MAIDQPPAIEAVVVQPARLPPGAGEAAFSIVQVTAETLASQPRLDEALTDVPGVSLFRRTTSLGSNPTTQGISLRGVAGSGASRALVTLDGVPQNDPFGGWVIWNGIPAQTLGGARIVRGAGAGPYGAGALTGAISLDERTTIPGGVAGEVSAGELGYWGGSAAVDAAAGSTRLLFALQGEHSDGWIPVERSRRGAADSKLALDNFGGSFRTLSDLGPGVLALRASAFTEKRQSGQFGAVSKAKGTAYSATYAVAPAGASLGWRVQAWLRTSDLANTSVAVAADRNSTTPANNQFATPARGYGVNAAVRRESSGSSLEVGADVRVADGETREMFRFMAGDFTRIRIAGGNAFVGGLYAEGSRTAGDWLLTAGVRLDHWRSYDAKRVEYDRQTGAVTLDERPANRDGLVPTARAGLRYSLDGGWSLRGAAYAGFRPATLNELHRPFRVGNDITEANAGLKPERLYGAEAGAGWSGAQGSWSGGVFYNRLEDAIANVTVGFGPGTFPVAGFIPAGGVLRQRQNAGSVDAYGVETEAEWRPLPAFTVNLAGAYTHAEVDGGSAAPQLTGLRPAQTPRVSALAGLSWQVAQPLSLRVDVRYEGMRYDDDLNLRKLGAGATVDFRADWRLAGPVSVFVAGENLFDSKIEIAETGDGAQSFGPPQRFRVGVSVRR